MKRMKVCRAAMVALAALMQSSADGQSAQATPRPNIVWIVSEDHGPQVGCYGDANATTPNIDRLAARGMRYARAWSCAPVCAPARTTLIAGMYATSLGAEHMRSMVPFPAEKKMFPQFLREAGYYCTNNAKEDYNVALTGQVWDESSKRAHWRNRAAGQPFFAVFNCEKSHEGQLRANVELTHDPAAMRVPAYHPDTPEVRRDWARYYDMVSAADADAGARLNELEQAGLAESTIVFYFADHGLGMPRHKRSACNAGLQVPLVVHIPAAFAGLRPPEYAAGGTSERVVSFVDFAPTLLSLAGIEPPAWMQGHAFLGEYCAEPRPYVFGFRGRMDERYDLVRAATDGRYVYVRNFMPHRVYGQHVSYMFQTGTTQVWKRLHDEQKLNAQQEVFWNTKPPEELYDLAEDPDEVHNLADSAEHQAVLARLRNAVRAWMLDVRDVGLLPEGEMHARAAGAAPYDFAHDHERYALERILETAELAAQLSPNATAALVAALGERDRGVRYWGASGLLMREGAGVGAGGAALVQLLADPSPDVRIAAAEGLARYGASAATRLQAMGVLEGLGDWSRGNVFAAMAALNALDAIGEPAQAVRERLRARPARGTAPHARYREYVPRLLSRG